MQQPANRMAADPPNWMQFILNNKIILVETDLRKRPHKVLYRFCTINKEQAIAEIPR